MTKIIRVNEESTPTDITADADSVTITVDNDGEGNDFVINILKDELIEALHELGVET